MKAPSDHRCEVMGSPWTGVYATSIDSARHYGKHWHANHGVGLLEQGAQRSASGRGKVDAHAGDLITTNPGEVHDGHPLGGPSRRWCIVYLDPGMIAAMAGRHAASAGRDVELANPVIHDIALRHALRQLFDRLAQWNASANRHHSDVDAMACEESLVRACGLLVDRHAAAGPAREEGGDVRRVRERLADELLSPPSLTDLASMTGIGKYQLLRRFERSYGVPPHAWLLLQRAERARALIRRGESLVHAAASSGFADQSHLTRIFGRQFGFTPGAWQRACNNVQDARMLPRQTPRP